MTKQYDLNNVYVCGSVESNKVTKKYVFICPDLTLEGYCLIIFGSFCTRERLKNARLHEKTTNLATLERKDLADCRCNSE